MKHKKASSLEDLRIYRESIELTKQIFNLCKSDALKKEFSLCDQVKRASTSICANIAEGYGRRTKADFSQFLSIALGSCNEVRAFLDIIETNYPNVTIEQIRHNYEILGRKIYAFRKTLLNR